MCAVTGQHQRMDEDEKSQISGDSSAVEAAHFAVHMAADAPLPVLIAAPHGGRAYPARLIENFRQKDAVLRLEDRHVDTLAREVATQTGAALIVAAAPRAMIDLNRAPDDVDWSMIAGEKAIRTRHSLANRRARSGLGLIPRRLPGTGEIWKSPLSRAELDRRIEVVHRPYHAALGKTLESLRDRWGAALLIDLHSMPPLRSKHPGSVAPEFVLGDRFGASCDARLMACALQGFAAAAKVTAHNRPYSGGYVLDRHGAPQRGLHAMQIEVCRSIYLDTRLEEPSARLPAVARLLAGIVRQLAGETAELGRSGQFRQAAE